MLIYHNKTICYEKGRTPKLSKVFNLFILFLIKKSYSHNYLYTKNFEKRF